MNPSTEVFFNRASVRIDCVYMLSNTSKRLAWIGLFLWISGCYEESPQAHGDPAQAGPGLLADAAVSVDASVDGRIDASIDTGGDAEASDADDAGTCSDAGSPVLEAQAISLWPPNHKFHEVAVEDCVRVQNGCGVQGEFIWASSDEPVDDKGDGHHAPDILISDDCQRVSVRAERQGPKDGRVYQLGVRFVDGDGNASEASCTIVIDHDRRGVVAADSGEKYRVTFDGTAGGPRCDGEVTPPPGSPANPPQPPANPPQDPPVESDAAVPNGPG